MDLNIIGPTAVISGSPATAVITPTTYSFTITATTGSGCEVNSYSGKITVLPDDGLTLTSPAATISQEICVSNDPILSRLTTITYQLSGGATSANFVGLPPGFGTIFNPLSKEYSILVQQLAQLLLKQRYIITLSLHQELALHRQKLVI